MLQTLIAAIIVVLAAVWLLANAYAKLNSSQSACGCGCSGCDASNAKKSGCDGSVQILDRIDHR